MKKIVISCVNIKSGGPLKVLKEFSEEIEILTKKNNQYDVIYIIHSDVNILNTNKVLKYKWPSKNYFYRVYFEYIYLYFLSRSFKPDLWISLNDSTPNVVAKKQITYYHNPTPFYNFDLKLLFSQPFFCISVLFYKYVYIFNNHRNSYIVLQQFWMKNKVKELIKNKNILVARPINNLDVDKQINTKSNSINKKFYFPAFPRFFKNFEVICKAVEILENENINNFLVYLTINGTENNYSKKIFNKYKHLKCIVFTGLLTPENAFSYYKKVDCLIFPSKLETWGLPITEAISHNLYILASDLDYAKESINDYKRTTFFNPNSPSELAIQMKHFISGTIISNNSKINFESPDFFNFKDLAIFCISQT
jgi:glycosyltransferase involved in cell wall biosynthesis